MLGVCEEMLYLLLCAMERGIYLNRCASAFPFGCTNNPSQQIFPFMDAENMIQSGRWAYH